MVLLCSRIELSQTGKEEKSGLTSRRGGISRRCFSRCLEYCFYCGFIVVLMCSQLVFATQTARYQLQLRRLDDDE